MLAVKHYKENQYNDYTLQVQLANDAVKTITYKNKPLMKNGAVVSKLSRWAVSIRDDIDGKYYAIKAVKSQLNAPDTAEMNPAEMQVAKVDNVLIVAGTVKALNLFGVPLTNHFIVRLVPDGDGLKVQKYTSVNKKRKQPPAQAGDCFLRD